MTNDALLVSKQTNKVCNPSILATRKQNLTTNLEWRYCVLVPSNRNVQTGSQCHQLLISCPSLPHHSEIHGFTCYIFLNLVHWAVHRNANTNLLLDLQACWTSSYRVVHQVITSSQAVQELRALSCANPDILSGYACLKAPLLFNTDALNISTDQMQYLRDLSSGK